jgi:hypothetical protein
VPLAYPEFEYVGSAPRILLALAFVVAGVSGIAPFIAESRLDPDPMNVMALAPVKSLSSVTIATLAGTTDTQSAEATFVLKPLTPTEANPTCQENTTEHLGGDCTQGKVHKPRSVPAANEQRAIAVVAITHSEEPAFLPSGSANPVASTPDGHDKSAKPVDTERANDAAPASAVVGSPMPPTSAKNVRPRSSYVQRHVRNAYSPSRRYGYYNYQSGYARVW